MEKQIRIMENNLKIDPEEIIKLLQKIIDKLILKKEIQNGKNVSATLKNRK